MFPVFFMVAIFSSAATLAFIDEEWMTLTWVVIASMWYGLYQWEKIN